MKHRTIPILPVLFVLAASCRSTTDGFIGLQAAMYSVNFLVWNQTGVPQTATIQIDNSKSVYSGVVPASFSAPAIVHHETLNLSPGSHEVNVTAPQFGKPKSFKFDVKRGTNLRVVFNLHDVEISVTYGAEVYQ